METSIELNRIVTELDRTVRAHCRDRLVPTRIMSKALKLVADKMELEESIRRYSED